MIVLGLLVTTCSIGVGAVVGVIASTSCITGDGRRTGGALSTAVSVSAWMGVVDDAAVSS
jgi:hypothetical protein